MFLSLVAFAADVRGEAFSPPAAPEPPPAGLRVSAEGLAFRFPPTLDAARFEGVGRAFSCLWRSTRAGIHWSG